MSAGLPSGQCTKRGGGLTCSARLVRSDGLSCFGHLWQRSGVNLSPKLQFCIIIPPYVSHQFDSGGIVQSCVTFKPCPFPEKLNYSFWSQKSRAARSLVCTWAVLLHFQGRAASPPLSVCMCHFSSCRWGSHEEGAQDFFLLCSVQIFCL